MKGKRQKDKATQSIYKGALYDRSTTVWSYFKTFRIPTLLTKGNAKRW
jgi:hypothetical protein